MSHTLCARCSLALLLAGMIMLMNVILLFLPVFGTSDSLPILFFFFFNIYFEQVNYTALKSDKKVSEQENNTINNRK